MGAGVMGGALSPEACPSGPARGAGVCCAAKCPPACPSWGWGRIRSEPPSVLRVKGDCGGRLFTAKLAVVVHNVLHQLLDDRPRHTLQRSEARSRGSVASTVGRVQRFTDSIAQARFQPCEPPYP